MAVASVRRRKFGTGAFDENWLNVDCCGLTCALITYALHFYAVYTVCFIMIPPWMSTKDEDGTRHLTTAGMFHRFAFTAVAGMACMAHFKAMTTNPGAVPPDAKPVPTPEETKGAANGTSGDEEKPLVAKQNKGMRLCRRCNAFKPRRAHHCRYVVYNKAIIHLLCVQRWIQYLGGAKCGCHFLLIVFFFFFCYLFYCPLTYSVCRRCIIKMDRKSIFIDL